MSAPLTSLCISVRRPPSGTQSIVSGHEHADGTESAMAEAHGPGTPVTPAPPQSRLIPDGYRQGLITAITVLLGFSLAFLRFWGFEAPGRWALTSILSTGVSVGAVVLQFIALCRSLRIHRAGLTRASS